MAMIVRDGITANESVFSNDPSYQPLLKKTVKKESLRHP
jgi:hypothetical protein